MRALGLLIVSVSLFGIVPSHATEAVDPYLGLDALYSFRVPSLDAAAMGRGSTNVAQGDGPAVLWWNPAAMSDAPGTALSASFSEEIEPYRRWSGAGTTNLGPLRFGFAVDRVHASDILLRTAYDPEGTVTPFTFLAGLLAASTDVNALFDVDDPFVHVNVGAAWRLHRIDIGEDRRSTGALDLGLRLRSREWALGGDMLLGANFGVSVANANDAVIESEAVSGDDFPQYIRWNTGGSLTLRKARGAKSDLFALTLAHERLSLRHEGETFGETERRYGAELVVLDTIIARCGAVGDPVLDYHEGFTLGFGARYVDAKDRFALQADYASVETSGLMTGGDLSVFSLRVVLRDVTLGLSGD